ncbi:MAG TPA: hypothetical protein VHR45_00735 [Thermoanaerobaculia bacterium]|nr:hypothetical protein [Thermoanaerobaculia bacterium]
MPRRLPARSGCHPPAGPATHIWVLLYAEVTQADGAFRRNVLLGQARAIPVVDPKQGERPTFDTRDAFGVATFFASKRTKPSFRGIERALADLFLPGDAPERARGRAAARRRVHGPAGSRPRPAAHPPHLVADGRAGDVLTGSAAARDTVREVTVFDGTSVTVFDGRPSLSRAFGTG